MRLVSDVLERGRSLLFRRREERELAEELALHLELEAERLEREEHVSAAEAQRRARVALGGVDRTAESVRDAWGTRALDDFLQNVRYALRQLGREGGFAALAVLTLAVGIAANATMFGVVDRLLLRPPSGVADPERATTLYFRMKNPSEPTGFSVHTATAFPVIEAVRRGAPAFSAVTGYDQADATLGQGGSARGVKLTLVGGDYFGVVGAPPALGRLLLPSDADAPVAVLSYGLWQSAFGGERGVIGRAVRLNARLVTVVGVAAREFEGLPFEGPTDVWGPARFLAPTALWAGWDNEGSFMWTLAARLRPGADVGVAASQATAALRAEMRTWRGRLDETGRDVVPASIIAARGPMGLPAAARVALWLEGVAVIVLLVACANIASLLLARMLRRRRELAMRVALGAGRGRLFRQLLTEVLVLSVLAGLAAAVLSVVGARAVRTFLLPGMRVSGSVLDGRVLAFTAGATLFVALLVGLAPAARAVSPALTEALKSGMREGGPRHSLAQKALLVAQATLSVVLLVGAGLFVYSLRQVRGRDVGVDLEHVLRVRMPLRQAGFDSTRIPETYRAAYEHARRFTAVRGATLVQGSSPMSTLVAWNTALPGRDEPPELPGGGPYYAFIDPGYFQTLGARVLRGRAFTAADEQPGARVVVVNDVLASHYWPDQNPLGKCLVVGSSGCRQVVGVVQQVLAFQLVNEQRALYYLPRTDPLAGPDPFRARAADALLLRVGPGTPVRAVAAAVRRDLQSLAPDMPYVDVQTYAQLTARQLEPWRLGAAMFGLFGALALAIAAVGLFSVLAYAVAQRSHEIGVRVALGAARGDVVRMVVLEGVRLVAYGLALGVLVALAAGRFIAPLLYDTSPRDPRVFGAVVAVLLASALAASILPARRAARVDPARVLAAD